MAEAPSNLFFTKSKPLLGFDVVPLQGHLNWNWDPLYVATDLQLGEHDLEAVLRVTP